MDAELAAKLNEIDAKTEEVRQALHKMQRYFQITFWLTIVFFVLPLIGLVYAVPKAMSSYTSSVNVEDIQGLQGLF